MTTRFKCANKDKKCALMNIDPDLLSDTSAEVLWNNTLKRRPNLRIALQHCKIDVPKKKAKKS